MDGWISNDEGESVSVWNNEDNKETISEWLVDEEQPAEPFVQAEESRELRNTFYDVYKIEINSIFEEPKLFHQEHVNKRQAKEEFDS